MTAIKLKNSLLAISFLTSQAFGGNNALAASIPDIDLKLDCDVINTKGVAIQKKKVKIKAGRIKLKDGNEVKFTSVKFGDEKPEDGTLILRGETFIVFNEVLTIENSYEKSTIINQYELLLGKTTKGLLGLNAFKEMEGVVKVGKLFSQNVEVFKLICN